MRKIIKDEAPTFWIDYIKKNRRTTYDQLTDTEQGREVRSQIKEHTIAHQKYLCCYCCGLINLDNSHNEHIKPKNLFPQLSMDYNNLLVSCTSKNTCGMAKGGKYDEKLFVSPLSADCETHFRFDTDGHIEGKTEAGRYTVALLNLNAYRLVDARRNLYIQCHTTAKCCGKDYVLNEYLQEKDGKLPCFADIVSYFYDQGDFDADLLNLL